MAEPLLRALSRLRGAVLDDEHLVRALGVRSPARPARAAVAPRRAAVRRPEGRPAPPAHGVRRHPGARLQPRRPARRSLDDLLDEPFANWHVETTTAHPPAPGHQEGPGAAALAARAASRSTPSARHDQAKERLLPEDHPVLVALGHLRPPGAGEAVAAGEVPPGRGVPARALRRHRRRQRSGRAAHARPTEDPLRVVDLGCGNAYLTFAAHAWLQRADAGAAGRRRREGAVAPAQHRGRRARSGSPTSSASSPPGSATSCSRSTPDVVLALHACDTATDDALPRAVDWEADLVLAAPCCHHDISAQLRRVPTPVGYAS